jgi:hypothetical protein
MRAPQWALALPLVAVLATGCGGGSTAQAQDGRDDGSTVTTEEVQAASGGSTTRMRVVLGGSGPDAGTSEAEASGTTCSVGLVGDGKGFGNQFTAEDLEAQGLTSLQVVVPDAAAAAAGTQDVTVTVGFGPQLSLREYELASGTATLQDVEGSPVLSVTGTTEQGDPLEVSLECGEVLRV